MTETVVKTTSKQEVIDACQRAVDEYRNYMDDESVKSFPVSLLDAIYALDDLVFGDDFIADASLLSVLDTFDECIPPLEEYVDNPSRKNHPGDDFHGPYRIFVAQFEKYCDSPQTPNPRKQKTVAEYVEAQVGKVTSQMIAREFGRTKKRGGQTVWIGPFFGSNGEVLPDVVRQELDEPHSVIPEDWVDPREVEEALEEQKEEQKLRLRRRENCKDRRLRRRKPNTATSTDSRKLLSSEEINDQILEGQNREVIAKLSGLTEDEVVAIGEELGVTPNWKDNPAPWVKPSQREVDIVEKEDGSTAIVETKPAPQLPQRPKQTSEEINQMVIDLHTAEPELSMTELAAWVSEESGVKLSRQKVTKIVKG